MEILQGLCAYAPSRTNFYKLISAFLKLGRTKNIISIFETRADSNIISILKNRVDPKYNFHSLNSGGFIGLYTLCIYLLEALSEELADRRNIKFHGAEHHILRSFRFVKDDYANVSACAL